MINDFLLSLEKVRPSGINKYMSCCPAHDDKSPSMVIFDHGDKIGVHCFAGCSVDEICASIGMEVKDLYEEIDIDKHNLREIVAQKRKAEEKEQAAASLFSELCVLKQSIEARMFNSDEHPKNITECWDREKQAIRLLPKLMKDYYK